MTAKRRTALCGTRSAYVAGCRCGECRAANAEYMAWWKQDYARRTGTRVLRGRHVAKRPAKAAD